MQKRTSAVREKKGCKSVGPCNHRSNLYLGLLVVSNVDDAVTNKQANMHIGLLFTMTKSCNNSDKHIKAIQIVGQATHVHSQSYTACWYNVLLTHALQCEQLTHAVSGMHSDGQA